jgi:hypothetical protein
MKIGPFAFWVISPFAGVQLWTYYCVLNASGLPAIAVELSTAHLEQSEIAPGTGILRPETKGRN